MNEPLPKSFTVLGFRVHNVFGSIVALQIINCAFFSTETQVRPPPPKRRALREANSLYFDEDFKKLRKDRMESQLRREEQEGDLRLQIMRAQVEELRERKLLHEQMRRYYEKAEANLSLGQNVSMPPAFPTLFEERDIHFT